MPVEHRPSVGDGDAATPPAHPDTAIARWVRLVLYTLYIVTAIGYPLVSDDPSPLVLVLAGGLFVPWSFLAEWLFRRMGGRDDR